MAAQAYIQCQERGKAEEVYRGKLPQAYLEIQTLAANPEFNWCLILEVKLPKGRTEILFDCNLFIFLVLNFDLILH